KNNSPAAAAAAAPSPQPSSLDPIASAAVAAAKLAPTGTGAITKVIPAEKGLAAVSPQATEKGKAGVPKSPAAEPFAFADFTWLTGNARTKEAPMDTTSCTPEIRADIGSVTAEPVVGPTAPVIFHRALGGVATACVCSALQRRVSRSGRGL